MSNVPDYMHVSFPADLIDGRVSTFYQSNYRLYVTDQDPALRLMAKSRSTTAMLAGGMFLDRVVKGIPLFTLEELQGELGITDPLNPNDARKHVLLNTVQATIHAVQQAVDFLVDQIPAYLDDKLVDELALSAVDHFPEIPRTLGEHVFQGMHLLYLPKGGSFQLPAGLILRYGKNTHGATLSTLVLSVLDLEDHPQRGETLALMKRVIAFRNSTIDAYMVDVLMPQMVEQIKAAVGQDQLEQFEADEKEVADATPIPDLDIAALMAEIEQLITADPVLTSQLGAVAEKMTLDVPGLLKQMAIWYLQDKRNLVNGDMGVPDYVRSVFHSTLDHTPPVALN